MTKLDEKLVDDLLQAALDLSESDRDDYLVKQCQDNTKLLAEVRSLLAATASHGPLSDDRMSSARDRLMTELFASDDKSEDLSGQTLGSWRIRQRIARGGLATVYIADRSDGEFQQKAAFKVLRRGLDTDDLISRFRAERQILSSLDHRSIAGILDGGALPDGRPYLVLEFVDGQPITDYCVEHNLGVRDKVQLMIEVLRALHHAHKHLVVHRDVKPSNILVTPEGKISLLDFGIAKILDPETMPGASTSTRTGISLLTPGYGSPEQHAGSPVTTASDVYQCGLVLFELLTGKRAFDGGTVSTTSLTASPHLVDKAGYRRVRGDLDAIVRKSTEGDPSRRYASADEMLLDLQRYLSGLPVLARPNSIGYRVTKLAKRRPWLFPAVGVAVLALIAYVTTITSYSQRLAEEQRLATASQQFLVDLFRSPDPFNPADISAGSSITVVEALELGRERVAGELADQPRLQASLYGSIADVYGSLDRQEDALELHEAALTLEKRLYGENSAQVAVTLRELTPLLRNAGLTEQAAATAKRQLQLAENLFAADSAELGLARVTAAIDVFHSGDVSGGREQLAIGLAVLRPYRMSYPSEMISALLIYAQILGFERTEASAADMAEAGAIAEEASDIARQAYGPGSLQQASVQAGLAAMYTNFGDYEASERKFSEALPVFEEHLGKDHSSSVAALSNFAFMILLKGDTDQAMEMFGELLERQRRLFGPDSRAVADTSQNLGATFSSEGRHGEAIELLEDAHRIYSTILNSDNYVIGFPLLTLAYSNIQLDRNANAEAAAREALTIFNRSVPDTHLAGVAQCLIGVALERQGNTTEGGQLIELSHSLLGKGSIGAHYEDICRYTP